MNIYYHPVWFVKDVIRGALIPAWIGVAAGTVGYLVVLDILGQCLRLAVRLFQRNVIWIWELRRAGGR